MASQRDEKRDAWRKGVDWFLKFDPSWQFLLGSNSSELVEDGCDCYTENTWGDVSFKKHYDNCDDAINDESCDFVETIYKRVYYFGLSDAFILAESAMNGPGRNYDAQLMDGSNHLQMKNDSNMKDAVNAIFEDGLNSTSPNPYFQTDKR